MALEDTVYDKVQKELNVKATAMFSNRIQCGRYFHNHYHYLIPASC